MRRVVEELGGRLVGKQGDSFLAEFSSSADAVEAAVRLWHLSNCKMRSETEEPLAYRFALNLGDVYDVDDDIHGDGVNITARLQTLAEPNTILVSGAIYDLIRDKGRSDFVFAGDHALKNISGRVRAYRWVPPVSVSGESAPPSLSGDAVAPIGRPTVEISPFRVLSGGRKARILCDTITEELTVMLSLISGLLVVRPDLGSEARGDGKRKPRESRPHTYHLAGTGAIDGGTFKLSVQLVDGPTGRITWTDRYTVTLGSEASVLDGMARSVATALQISLTEGEHARLWSRLTSDGRAWEAYQRGRDRRKDYTRNGNQGAQQHYRHAIALDPVYPAAIASLGYALMDDIRMGWTSDPDALWPQLRALHKRALHLEPNYPDTHGLGAYILVLERRYDEAIATMRHAIKLSQNDAELTAILGLIYAYAGRTDEAILAYEQAIRMNPYAPLWLRHNLAMAYRRSRRLPEALDTFYTVIKGNPGFVRSLIGLTSVLSRLGRTEEARSTAAEVVRLDPLFRIDDWAGRQPTLDRSLIEEIKEDLRRAGLN